MAITQAELENWFKFHPATPAQGRAYDTIREAGLQFARFIVSETPAGDDQKEAIRKIREAVFTANAAIACQESDGDEPSVTQQPPPA